MYNEPQTSASQFRRSMFSSSIVKTQNPESSLNGLGHFKQKKPVELWMDKSGELSEKKKVVEEDQDLMSLSQAFSQFKSGLKKKIENRQKKSHGFKNPSSHHNSIEASQRSESSEKNSEDEKRCLVNSRGQRASKVAEKQFDVVESQSQFRSTKKQKNEGTQN